MATEYNNYPRLADRIDTNYSQEETSPQSKLQEKINKRDQRIYDKTKRLYPELANTLSAGELQQKLSDAVDSQVYTRSDGSQYTIDYMLDDNGLSQGTREVEYKGDGSKYGVRNLYIDDTAEGNYKLGLARSDQGGYEGRYDTLLHPTWKRAKNNQLAGPRGVTPDDGALLNITLPYNKATEFEYLVHSNKGQIENRVGGITQSEIDQNRPDFGAGISEYTSPNAPMWNIYYQQSDNVLPEDTYMPKLIETQQPSSYKDRLAALDTNNKSIFDKIIEEGAQTFASGLAGIGKGAVELADVAQELGTYGIQLAYNKATGKNIDIDLIDKDLKDSWVASIDNIVGYNRSLDEAKMREARKELKKANIDVTSLESLKQGVKDPGKRKYLTNTLGILADPSLVVGFITEIIGSGVGLGTGVKVAAKIGTKVLPKLTTKLSTLTKTNYAKALDEIKAIKQNTRLTQAEKASQIAKLQKDYTLSKKIPDLLKGSVFTNADMMVRTNKDLEEYKKNNNGVDADVKKTLEIILMNRLLSSTEVASLKSAAKVGGELTEESTEILNNVLSDSIGHIAESVGKESAQETLDSVGEQINQKLNSSEFEGKTIQEILQATSADILLGTLSGSVGGGMLSSGTVGLEPLINKAKEAYAGSAEDRDISDRKEGVGKYALKDKKVLQQELDTVTQYFNSLEESSPDYREAWDDVRFAQQELELRNEGTNTARVLYDRKYAGTENAITVVSTNSGEALNNLNNVGTIDETGNVEFTAEDLSNMNADLNLINEELKLYEEEGTNVDADSFKKYFSPLAAIYHKANQSNSITEEQKEKIKDTFLKTLQKYNNISTDPKEITDDMSHDEKVQTILRSKFSNMEALDEELKNEELTDIERTALEAKKISLEYRRTATDKNAATVYREKFIDGQTVGGKYLPGVNTWIELLGDKDISVRKMAKEGIVKFVSSQRAKLDRYKAAGIEYEKQKAEILANDTLSTEEKNQQINDLEIDIGKDGKNLVYYNYKTKALVESLEFEQKSIDALEAMTKEGYNTKSSTKSEFIHDPDGEPITEYKPEDSKIIKGSEPNHENLTKFETPLEKIGYTEIFSRMIQAGMGRNDKNYNVFKAVHDSAIEYDLAHSRLEVAKENREASILASEDLTGINKQIKELEIIKNKAIDNYFKAVAALDDIHNPKQKTEANEKALKIKKLGEKLAMVNGLSDSSYNAFAEKIASLSNLEGKDFDDLHDTLSSKLEDAPKKESVSSVEINHADGSTKEIKVADKVAEYKALLTNGDPNKLSTLDKHLKWAIERLDKPKGLTKLIAINTINKVDHLIKEYKDSFPEPSEESEFKEGTNTQGNEEEPIKPTKSDSNAEGQNVLKFSDIDKSKMTKKTLSRVTKINDRLAKYQNPTEPQRRFLKELREELEKKNTFGKDGKFKYLKNENTHIESIKEASRDNTEIGGSEEDQDKKRERLFKENKNHDFGTQEDVDEQQLQHELDQAYGEAYDRNPEATQNVYKSNLTSKDKLQAYRDVEFNKQGEELAYSNLDDINSAFSEAFGEALGGEEDINIYTQDVEYDEVIKGTSSTGQTKPLTPEKIVEAKEAEIESLIEDISELAQSIDGLDINKFNDIIEELKTVPENEEVC